MKDIIALVIVVLIIVAIVGIGYKLSCKYEFIAFLIDSRCYEYEVIRKGAK